MYQTSIFCYIQIVCFRYRFLNLDCISLESFSPVTLLGKIIRDLLFSSNVFCAFEESSRSKLVRRLLFLFRCDREDCHYRPIPLKLEFLLESEKCKKTVQSQSKYEVVFSILLITVSSFLPKCFSNGINFLDVCTVDLITPNEQTAIFLKTCRLLDQPVHSLQLLDWSLDPSSCRIYIQESKYEVYLEILVKVPEEIPPESGIVVGTDCSPDAVYIGVTTGKKIVMEHFGVGQLI